jgi:hypothetical protein
MVYNHEMLRQLLFYTLKCLFCVNFLLQHFLILSAYFLFVITKLKSKDYWHGDSTKDSRTRLFRWHEGSGKEVSASFILLEDGLSYISSINVFNVEFISTP